MTPKCGRPGCDAPGLRGLKYRMWAKGHPKSSHSPAEGAVRMPLCENHAYEDAVSGEALKDPAFRRNLLDAMAALGKAAPDIDGAQISVVDYAEVEAFIQAWKLH
jgi:hypothetical protein